MSERPLALFKDIDESRVYAMLSYLSVLCAIPLLLKRDDAFVQDHARQGLALFLSEFFVFLFTIIFPWLLKPTLFVFGLMAFWGMLKALKGDTVCIPIVHRLAKRLSL